MGELKKIYLYIKNKEYDTRVDIDELETIRLDNISDVFYEANAIIITDDTEILKATNMPYVVYLHAGNSNQSFPSGAYCVEEFSDLTLDYFERIYKRFMNIPWTITNTTRLSIEEITTDDVYSLKELYRDKEITRYMEDLFPLEEELQYTRDYIKNVYGFYGYGMWLIKLKTTREIIGRVGVESKEGFDGLELGFMLGLKYQHQGYAYEACMAVIDYALNELDTYEFRALVHKENEASKRLCRKLGFIQCGLENDFIDFRLQKGKKDD